MEFLKTVNKIDFNTTFEASFEVKKEKSLEKTFTCSYDENNNVKGDLVFRRFQYESFATRTCGPTDNIYIGLQPSQKMSLSAIAFASAINIPSGQLGINVESSNGVYKVLMEQQIDFPTKKRTPRNYMPTGNVILEPNTNYVIVIKLSKDVTYYKGEQVSNVLYQGDGSIPFKVYSEHDIISHFFFNECF